MDPTTDPAFNSATPIASRSPTPTPLASTSVSLSPSTSGSKSRSQPRSSASSSTKHQDHGKEVIDLTPDDHTTRHSDQTTGSAAAAATTAATAITLEQEVGQVVSQLSSWGGNLWGGFRKQTAAAAELVKKDFTRTVSEAKEELRVLQSTTVEVVAKSSALTGSGEKVESTDDDIVKGKGKGKEREILDPEGNGSTTHNAIPTSSSAPVSDLFSRLSTTLTATMHEAQSHLPANLRQLNSSTLSSNLASLQKSFSETIASNPHLDVNNLSAMRSSLTENIQKNLNAAGTAINFKQAERLAEEYLKKSEGLLHDAGEFLKEAVKVVPPEEGGASYQGMAWDGSDMYAFSTSVKSTPGDKNASTTQGGGGGGNSPSRSMEFTRASRKDALLKRLRTDRQLLLVDPAGENETPSRREAFQNFVKDTIESQGGVDGEQVRKQIEAELAEDQRDILSFKATKDALVPSALPEAVFWSRYLFHKRMIELEEEKRQRLLRATEQADKEEDFSWDDAEEDTTSPITTDMTRQTSEFTLKTQTATSSKPEHKRVSTLAGSAATLVPAVSEVASGDTSRRSSDESYDVVSEPTSDATGKTPTKQASVSSSPEKDESDEDSDWE